MSVSALLRIIALMPLLLPSVLSASLALRLMLSVGCCARLRRPAGLAAGIARCFMAGFTDYRHWRFSAYGRCLSHLLLAHFAAGFTLGRAHGGLFAPDGMFQCT